MGRQSLEDAVQHAENPVELLRSSDGRWDWPSEVAREYTNWIDEYRAVRETCVLADVSYHQMDQVIGGPDALQLLSDLCVNDLEGFEFGQAKQAIMCSPDGHFIGDGVLQPSGDGEYVLSGKSPAAHWLEFHIETGDYDAYSEIYEKASLTDRDPHFFTYQVQGPTAAKVVEDVVETPLIDLPFFNVREVSLNGKKIRALRHGMAGEIGFEFQGPFRYGEEIKQTLLDAGQEHGIKRLGTRAYEPLSVLLGWITNYVVPIYDGDGMGRYRQWLTADDYEGTYSLAGSFRSNDIRDYYMNPFEMGYGNIVSFDHDFIGREALEDIAADPKRTRVTLEWNEDDVVDIFGSLFRPGTPYKRFDLPRDRWGAHYDKVLSDDEIVGISKSFAYSYTDRKMVSICCIDLEYSEPGTEVTFVWGEQGGTSPNPLIENHAQKEIRATVAPSPYIDDKR